MTVIIEKETDLELPVDYEAIIQKVAEAALDYADCPYEARVDVLITDNLAIQIINREHRGIDRPTDVLSFPMIEYDCPGDFDFLESADISDYFDPDSGELLLGDIILSVDKIIEQAGLYGHSIERELGFLVAHSMLHLFGYDHMEDDERILMEEKQRDIMNMTGLKR